MPRKRSRTPAMGARSRRKGSRVERDVARLLQESLGGRWSRVPLSGGWGNRAEFATCGDVITTIRDFPFVIECKAVEGWHLEQILTAPDTCPIASWWQQTKGEAAEARKKPLLVFTRNFQPLYAVARHADATAAGLSTGGDVIVAHLDGEGVVISLFEHILPRLQIRYGVNGRSDEDAGEALVAIEGQR